MNLRHLQVFTTVVECGSVTRASERLYIAQPSVSQTIAEIEREYNVLLFERLNKRLYLTEIGKIIYEKSKLLLKDFAVIDETLRDSSRINAIRIGATVTIGNCMLAKLIKAFEDTHSVTYDNIVVDNTERIINFILDGTIDVAIVEGCVDNENINIKEVCTDEVVLVGGKNYAIDNSCLHNFIVREVGSGTRDLAIECAKSAGFNVGKLWEMSSTQAILDMLKVKDCATGISRRLVADDLASGELKLLSPNTKSRFFYFIRHKDKTLTGVMQEFSDYVSANLSKIE